MIDSRMEDLARNVVNYSVSLKPGEKVLINYIGEGLSLAKQFVKEVYKAGGIPFIKIEEPEINRLIIQQCTKEQLELMTRSEILLMREMDAYIKIGALQNSSEMSGVDTQKFELYNKYHIKPVHLEERVNNTKWCVLRYPSHSMAQLAQMSTEDFEDFYFKVCNLDYAKMSKAMDNLVDIMGKTDRVRILGNDTDLTFSIKGLPVVKASGNRNLPDGEVRTAPVIDSVNGIITYNTPSEYEGFTFENIRLEFKNGKIVNAAANDTDRINKVLDTDDGARYIGEFSFGLNPYINQPMKETLFDEKINGSIHFTPGSCCVGCHNGNKSAIHWDLVLIQRSDYGGGEIWFDNVLIRKDGRFVIPELECLNPENLR